MNDNELRTWIDSVVKKTPLFLNKMKDEKTPGRFRYSLSGDIRLPLSWGLGNTVFATKTYYMLNQMQLADVANMSQYIKSFRSDDSYISDPAIQLLSWPLRIVNSIRSFDFNNFFGEQNKRAETRQAFAALKALNNKPDDVFRHIPYSREEIFKYIHSLDWSQPWGAASHFSHLIFFLAINKEFFSYKESLTEELLQYAFEELKKYNQQDGSWHKTGVSIENFQKINAGMKVMTAFGSYNKLRLSQPEKLIDLCFSTLNSGNACNHFNLICLLYNCSKQTDYKKKEIIIYFLERLKLYKNHWRDDTGGFSFFARNANKIYYSAYISKGLPEPDIHGTHLFLWGIVLICETIGWNDYGLQPPIT